MSYPEGTGGDESAQVGAAPPEALAAQQQAAPGFHCRRYTVTPISQSDRQCIYPSITKMISKWSIKGIYLCLEKKNFFVRSPLPLQAVRVHRYRYTNQSIRSAIFIIYLSRVLCLCVCVCVCVTICVGTLCYSFSFSYQTDQGGETEGFKREGLKMER